MDVVALVALVVAITQVIKKIVPVSPDVLAVVFSILVVGFKALETGTPFNLALLVILGQVIAGAIGAFKLAMQVSKNARNQ